MMCLLLFKAVCIAMVQWCCFVPKLLLGIAALGSL